jgi:hypothetical protein
VGGKIPKGVVDPEMFIKLKILRSIYPGFWKELP